MAGRGELRVRRHLFFADLLPHCPRVLQTGLGTLKDHYEQISQLSWPRPFGCHVGDGRRPRHVCFSSKQEEGREKRRQVRQRSPEKGRPRRIEVNLGTRAACVGRRCPGQVNTTPKVVTTVFSDGRSAIAAGVACGHFRRGPSGSPRLVRQAASSRQRPGWSGSPRMRESRRCLSVRPALRSRPHR